MKIAITGGIGSGKSAVIKILAEAGQKTISLDDVYKELLNDESFVLGVCSAVDVDPKNFGERYTIDFDEISKKVFSNGEVLARLNAFTHPQIFKEAFRRGSRFESDGGVVFYEVPLLFEGDYQNLFDSVWVVIRKIEDRIESAAIRDGVSEYEIKKRINNQFNYEKVDFSSHTIISNDGDFVALKNKVLGVLNEVYANI